MEKKKLNYINKAYDSLYDVVSRFGLFRKELESIEKSMKEIGYKVKINGFDKCVFIKAEKSAEFSKENKREEKKNEL